MKSKVERLKKFALLLMTLLTAFFFTGILAGCGDPLPPPGDPFPDAEPTIWQQGSNLVFSWDAVPNATAYEIHHSGSRLGEKTLLGEITQTTYTHTEPNENKYENYYTVVPKAANGNSIIGLRWNKIDDAVKYQIFRKDRLSNEFLEVGETVEREFTDSVTDYDIKDTEYRIDPINSGGNAIKSSFDLDVTVPSGVSELNKGRSTTRNIVINTFNPQIISFERDIFGSSVYLYDAKYDSTDDIAHEINRIADGMRSSVNDVQMSAERFSFYFKPGDYVFNDRVDVGFYMTVAGLGLTPVETRLGGTIYTPPALSYSNEGGGAGANGTHNFWRSIENFEIYRPDGKPSVTLGWAVSQAAPMRRISVASGVNANFHYNGGWVSGGFAADIRYGGNALGGGQQQWYTRNSHFGGLAFDGVGWNKYTIASTGAAHSSNYMTGGNSTWVADGIDKMREKPFLYYDGSDYKVFVPGLRDDALGVSWTDTDPGVGRSVAIEDFYVAKPGDSAAKVNARLAAGKHLFYTPGLYGCDAPVFVKMENQIVLGTGLATIYPEENNTEGAMLVSDVSGVTLAGFLIDAHFSTKYLLRVGEVGSNKDHSANPTFISDVFARVGGFKTTPVHAEVSVDIHSNNVIGDHFWIWRADHGRSVTGGRWTGHEAPFGLIVHGNDVTMHGLFVEHFQKYQTLWLGEKGHVYFYQNESPYDAPNQDAYMSHDGTVKGWSAFKVANHVGEFYAIGMGMYGVFNVAPNNLANAIEVPNKEGVKLEAIYVNEIGSKIPQGSGTLNIINGTGGAAINQAGVRMAVFDGGVASMWRGGTIQYANGITIPTVDYGALLAKIY